MHCVVLMCPAAQEKHVCSINEDMNKNAVCIIHVNIVNKKANNKTNHKIFISEQ